jgi:FG-GAP-like repeat
LACSAPTNCPVGGVGPYAVTTADLNHDSYPEIIVANRGIGTVGVLLNDKTGNFKVMDLRNYDTFYGVSWVSIGHVVGDGYPDIFISSGDSNAVGVLLNSGSANFTVQQPYYDLFQYTDPVSGQMYDRVPEVVQPGDFNGDGITDLVTANSDSNTVTIFIGNLDGTFESPAIEFSAGPIGYSAYSLTVVDINNDCLADIAVAEHAIGGGKVSILVNTSK